MKQMGAPHEYIEAMLGAVMEDPPSSFDGLMKRFYRAYLKVAKEE